MRIGVLLVLASGTLVTAQMNAVAKADLEKLQGTWAIESMVTDGTPAPKEKLTAHKVVIRENRITGTVKFGDGDECTFTLDASRRPKVIQFTPTKGKPSQAIYTILGSRFEVCRSIRGAAAPAKFDAAANSGQEMITFKKMEK